MSLGSPALSTSSGSLRGGQAASGEMIVDIIDCELSFDAHNESRSRNSLSPRQHLQSPTVSRQNSLDRTRRSHFVGIMNHGEASDYMGSPSHTLWMNNEEQLLRDIESHSEESGLEEIGAAEQAIIRTELTQLERPDDIRNYCIKVCDYYIQKVAILMRQIHRAKQLGEEFEKVSTERDKKIARLAKELEEHKLFERRLKELEIENTQLKKVKTRLEERDSKYRSVEKQATFYKDLIEGNSEQLSQFSTDDLIMWESKVLSLATKLASKKSDLLKDMTNRSFSSSGTKKCVICEAQPVGVIIKDCNHIVMCWGCAIKVDKCPLDRKKISSIEKVYLP